MLSSFQEGGQVFFGLSVIILFETTTARFFFFFNDDAETI